MAVTQRDALLAAALDVFRERGYADTSLEEVARRARADPETLRMQFGDKAGLLNALLKAHSPLDALEGALDSAEGETAEELLRDALHRLVGVAQRHVDFFELAVIDSQINGGTFLAGMSAKLFPKALGWLNRVKATGQLRPLPDVIVGRTLAALLIGFVLSERAMPQVAQMAMRLFPQRAWLDGMIDLLLYGAIEDEAR